MAGIGHDRLLRCSRKRGNAPIVPDPHRSRNAGVTTAATTVPSS
jgi:hypothetical protein